jgi:hypothetical protein
MKVNRLSAPQRAVIYALRQGYEVIQENPSYVLILFPGTRQKFQVRVVQNLIMKRLIRAVVNKSGDIVQYALMTEEEKKIRRSSSRG